MSRQELIRERLRLRREIEKSKFIDQSKSGWSNGMTWQEILDARGYRNLHVSKL